MEKIGEERTVGREEVGGAAEKLGEEEEVGGVEEGREGKRDLNCAPMRLMETES